MWHTENKLSSSLVKPWWRWGNQPSPSGAGRKPLCGQFIPKLILWRLPLLGRTLVKGNNCWVSCWSDECWQFWWSQWQQPLSNSLSTYTCKAILHDKSWAVKPPNLWWYTRWANHACSNLLQRKEGQDTRQESLHLPPPSGATGREAFPGPLGSFCNAAPNFMILFWKATKNHLVIPRGASGSSLRQQRHGAALPCPSGSFGRCLSECAVPACSLPSSGHQPCW